MEHGKDTSYKDIDSFVDSYDIKNVGETTVDPIKSSESDIDSYVNDWPVDIGRGTSLSKDENIEEAGTISEQLDDQLSAIEESNFSRLEATTTLATGITGMIASGVIGTGTVFAQSTKNVLGMKMSEDDIRKYPVTDVMATIQDAMIYKPTSELGKEIIETIAIPGEWWHEKVATNIGDMSYFIADYFGGKLLNTGTEEEGNRELSKFNQELSSTIGANMTAVADIAMPIFIINKAIKPALKLKKSLSSAIKDVRENAIDEYIYNEFDSINTVKQRHAELIDLEKKIPGYEASITELTQSPRLASVQRDLASKSPQRKMQNVERIKNNRKAIISFMDETIGVVFKNDKVVMREMEKVLTESKGSIDAAINYLIKKSESNIEQQSILAKKLSKKTKQDAGADLRRTMERGYKINKLIGRMNYDRVGNPRVNSDSFVDSFIKESAAPDFKALVEANSPAIPPIFYEISGVIKKSIDESSVIGKDGKSTKIQPTELDFTQLKDWDQRINKTIRMLERKQDAGRELYFMNQLSKNVNNSMDSLLGRTDKVAESYRYAKDYWKKNVFQKHETGIVGEILKTDIKGKNGVYKVIDEKVIDTIFNKGVKTSGGSKAISEFLNIYGDHPVAMMQLKDGVYRKLKDYADPKNTGILDQGKVEQFLYENKAVFDSLPEWKKDFSDIKRVNHGLASSVKREVAAKQLLQNHELTKSLGGENPFKMIKTALSSPEAMRELMVRVSNNPNSKEALSRAVAHYVFGKAVVKDKRGIWTVDHVKANKILNDPANAKSLDMIFGAEHVKNMDAIVKAWESQSPYRMIAEEKINPMGATMEQSFEKNVGTSLKSMMGDIRLIGVRHVPPQYIAGGWAIRKISSFREAVLEESIAKSFFDKDLATIVNEVIEMEKTAIARSKQTSSTVKSDMLRLKNIEKKLRENMLKTGEFGFDKSIAGAQAIANVGRIKDDDKEKKEEPPLLRVQ